MKTPGFINRTIKAVKKIFQPKVQKKVAQKPQPETLIPKHETKSYHKPPENGIAKNAAKKRRAKIRQQKLSRRINRKAA